MSDDVRISRCFRCHRIIKIQNEGQQYGPICTKKVDVEENLRDEKDHARKECAEAYSYVDCLACENSECEVILSHVQEVLNKEYWCDNEKSYYFGTRIEKPLKHHEDCMFAERANITCMQCAFMVGYEDGILMSRQLINVR